jgi:hypothetical protein
VPPEVLAAAAQASSGAATWQCAVCSLLNSPAANKCDACATPKMVSDAHHAEVRAQEEHAAKARANAMSGGKKKRTKGITMSFQEMNRQQAAANSVWGRR